MKISMVSLATLPHPPDTLGTGFGPAGEPGRSFCWWAWSCGTWIVSDISRPLLAGAMRAHITECSTPHRCAVDFGRPLEYLDLNLPVPPDFRPPFRPVTA